MNRTFVIGDVHGCLTELKQLARYVKASDRVVLLGDLMDRGPDPVGVVRFVRLAGFECIKGNHDDKHVRYRRHVNAAALLKQKIPMQMDPVAAEQNQQLSDYQIDWLAHLPTALELGNNWIAVHAGFEPFKPLDQQVPEKCMRIRYVKRDGTMKGFDEGSLDQPLATLPWQDLWLGPKSVVYGHQVYKDVYLKCLPGNVVCAGIDTGCCYGGKLTAMILEENGTFAFISVDAGKCYFNHRIPKVLLT
jgi:bis(5'-nucleosyl)-tetraphosphatase (symmetrical)